MYAWLSGSSTARQRPRLWRDQTVSVDAGGAVLWSLFVDSSLCRLCGTATARQQLYQQFGCSTTQAVSWLAAA